MGKTSDLTLVQKTIIDTLHKEALIEAPKPLLTVQPEPSQIVRGEAVTLTCDIQGEGWTYNWQCGEEQDNSVEKELKITVESQQKCRCYGCRQSFCSQLSENVTLAVLERPKPCLNVQPEPSQIFRGETVTLTCDIQETDVSSWIYSWNKDDSLIHVSQSQEYRISAVSESHTGNYSCTGRETRGSRYSRTSDKVTLTVSGSEAPLPVLSVLKLLSFLLAASPYLLVSIILGVKCYRAHVQTDGIYQYIVTEV
ncbi:low affinity immunoglobulin gamma Fc region receptor II-like [Onychostoma macrolepis]|uniref:low affinity immunoglobulin gamma Fc region receptor II-like n=1 Tax=Onychostoma macrolepis TaxID=369639 RepID=UPI00272C1ADE|nr:low affinity immunoglobulin gamma Fc region receptor II-like [Onychostoma macrolepis]